MTQLSPHFGLAEFTQSQTAIRRGINNTPSSAAIDNLTRVAQLLESVRTLLGNQPISISSGYRSPGVNAAVGGAPNSRHLLGLAADFTCPSFGEPRDICLKIKSSALIFDQLIFEGTWVHIGLSPAGEQVRQQILTAHFKGGTVTYTESVV
ncbi:D-Ala-D-Ala carboxypeptidase family metallohydrolase [Paraburkholderia diazotrophica]|uniref:Peptidase M15 n=1 Tax=Paraburkholderia diazotrophica TaxID=667676 RepID=A0A1H7DTB4_9BURK|nr:D-Ala-D-Ala carboxypeptidase family metallohydrolase [Paraburkholderia diazotrophica]SEK02550.1 Peptidase M15 [Paraburkholderia diazotrophica]